MEAALYFAKFYDKVVISLDFPPDQVFYEAQVLRTKMQPRNPSLQHHIINSTSISKDDEIPIFIPSLISIQAISDKDSQGIQLVLRRSLTTKLSKYLFHNEK